MARQHIIGGVIVKERHPFAPLGLSIITLGIYFFVWWYLINDETRRLGEKASPGISLLAWLPGAVLIVPPFVTIWTTTDRIARIQERARVANPISPIVALVLTIIPIVNLFAWAYLQGGLNRAYELIATHGQAPGGYAQAPPSGYYPPPSYQQPYPQQPYPPQGYQQPYPQQPYPPQGYQQPYPPQQPPPPQYNEPRP